MEDILRALADTYKKVPTREEFTKAFELAMKAIDNALSSMNARIDARLAQLKDGKDGHTPSKKELTDLIKPLIPKPVKGDKGDPGNTIVLFGKKDTAPVIEPDTADEIIRKINQDSKALIVKEAVDGLPELEKKVQQIELRPVGGKGGAKGFMLYVDGQKKLLTAQNLNLIAGTGVTLSYNYANGRNDITINAAGGSFSVLPKVTGTIDDSNMTFTFASTPALVVVNGTSYRSGHGCTIASTTVTLDAPVGTGGDVYGLG